MEAGVVDDYFQTSVRSRSLMHEASKGRGRQNEDDCEERTPQVEFKCLLACGSEYARRYVYHKGR